MLCAPARPDAVLSCEFRTETDPNPRIEWKKREKGMTFVYFDHQFHGELQICTASSSLSSLNQEKMISVFHDHFQR